MEYIPLAAPILSLFGFGGNKSAQRRARAAEQQAREQHALRVQAEASAKAAAAAAQERYERTVREAEQAEIKAKELREEEARRHNEMMEAARLQNEAEMAKAKIALEHATNEAEEARRTAEAKASQAAENATMLAEAKAEADARDLRQASDNAVINEPPTAHELKHSEICAYLKVDMSLLIAHIGRTGLGKSSFINAERGLKDNDEGAARTDFVECTRTTAAFRMPNQEYVIVDVPGCGARGFLLEEQLNLIGFDYLLIFITGGRIVRDDIALAKYAVKNGIKMAFIHSRCDEILRNLFEHCENEIQRDAVKQDFINRMNTELQTQLRSWEDDGNHQIQLAGININLVSAPATRAIVQRSNGKPYREEALLYALPDDLTFVQRISEIAV